MTAPLSYRQLRPEYDPQSSGVCCTQTLSLSVFLFLFFLSLSVFLCLFFLPLSPRQGVSGSQSTEELIKQPDFSDKIKQLLGSLQQTQNQGAHAPGMAPR